jgi:mannose-6-phosphate isomerase-like protein (cupin superfamily)
MQHQEEWPEELDALRAAPGHHVLLMENERVRVLDTRIGAGELAPLHTHRWPSTLYIMSWSDFVRRDADGAVMADSRGSVGLAEGSAVWSGPVGPHTLENVGARELRVISVEMKG